MPEVKNPMSVVRRSESDAKEELAFEPDDLKVLRKTLDACDEEEIANICVSYARTMEQLIQEFPSMAKATKIDWAISMALSPDWYSDKLVARIQNTMLVAALLLTVTSATLIAPPFFGYDITIKTGSSVFRVFFYLDIFCNFFFLISIFFGVCFIENGMSRAYTEAEKFNLIIRQYSIKDAAQICSVIGFILFPFTICVPLWDAIALFDANMGFALTAIYSVLVIIVQVVSMQQAANKQASRTKRFLALTDDSGHLLPKYYPKNADMSVQDFTDMYSK